MGGLLALFSSLIYGFTDFTQGRTVRFTPLLVTAQLMALGGLLFWLSAVLFLKLSINITGIVLLDALLIGVFCIIAKICNLTAYQSGPIGVVVAASAATIALPVIYDLLVGQAPTWPQLFGIISIFVGLFLMTRKKKGIAFSWKAFCLGLTAAALYGVNDIILKIGVYDVFGIALMAALFKFLAFSSALFAKKIKFNQQPQTTAILLSIGFANGAAVFFFADSLKSGNVSISTVLASLAPLISTGLAYLFLEERLSRLQLIGLCLSVFGVIPII